jgi:hypothetical protein
MSAFYFVWENQPDIGYHQVCLMNDKKERIPASDMWLQDYTGEWQRNKRIGTRFENIAYEIGYCHGYSYDKSYTFNDGRTLEDMKKECEQYIISAFNNRLKAAEQTISELKPICEWFNNKT